MTTEKNTTMHVDGKNYIPNKLLDQMMDERDRHIRRIELATETKRKLIQAQTLEEYKAVQIPDEFKVFGNYDKLAMDSYVSGFAMANNDGSPRCYYGNMGSLTSILFPVLFRGELCDYGVTSGFSSLGRKIRFDTSRENIESKYFCFFVEQIRRVIFMGFLSFFSQYRNFQFGEPLDGLIAQHYGINTQYLDLTDDIKVALFFASCKHTGKNKFRPITEGDISDLSKNGVLYSGINDKAQVIGYQPFCRCHRQRGYYIDTASMYPCWNFSLSSNTGFVKYYFDRTVKLSERLYDEFDGGKRLFPKDGLEPFSDVIQSINDTKLFPYESFDIAYIVLAKYLNVYHDNGMISDDLFRAMSNKDRLVTILRNEGFELCSQLNLPADKAIIDAMNKSWNPDDFAKKEGILYSPFLVSTMT